jgi:hypothetical protein
MVPNAQNPGFKEKAGVNALFQPGFFLETGLEGKRKRTRTWLSWACLLSKPRTGYYFSSGKSYFNGS